MAGDNLESIADNENLGAKKPKILTYGLALGLAALPLLSQKAIGDMLYNDVYSVPMYKAYSQKPEVTNPAEVRVRVDTVKKDNNRYDVYFSIFTKDYNLRMPGMRYYNLINDNSRLCVAYSDNLSINPYKMKQRSHGVFRKSGKDMHCEWDNLVGVAGEMPVPGFIKKIEQIYDTFAFFLKPQSQEIKELAENYHIMEIPFYTASHQESARMFIIPVCIEGKGESKLKFLSSICLQKINDLDNEHNEAGSKKISIDIILK